MKSKERILLDNFNKYRYASPLDSQTEIPVYEAMEEYAQQLSSVPKWVKAEIKKVAECAFNSATQIEGAGGFENWWQEELLMNKKLREWPSQPTEPVATDDDWIRKVIRFVFMGAQQGGGYNKEVEDWYFEEIKKLT